MTFSVKSGLIVLGAIVLCANMAVVNAAESKAKRDSEVQRIDVIPQPQRILFVGKGFHPRQAKVIRTTDTAEGRCDARLLRQALRESHGIDCEIVLTPSDNDKTFQLSLCHEMVFGPMPPSPVGHGDESYALRVTDKEVVIAGTGSAGLFYGVQTLIQLIGQAERDKCEIPGLDISDWPTFTIRGKYIDSDQFGIPLGTPMRCTRITPGAIQCGP